MHIRSMTRMSMQLVGEAPPPERKKADQIDHFLHMKKLNVALRIQ